MDGSVNSAGDSGPEEKARWREVLAKYQQPSAPRALWQIVNTLVPYVGLWYLMYWLKDISLWLTVPLALLAGGLLVRVFIIFHDCGHGSFFKSRRANDVMGFIAGVLTFTPYYHWRWEHAIHHGTSGDLDRRGTGDVWTMTVQEYLESSRWKRFAYRLARNPVVLFVIAPLFLFRDPAAVSVAQGARRGSATRCWWMNLAILGMAAGAELALRLQGLSADPVDRHGRWPAPRASGCSTCSTSSRTSTGSAARSGTTPRRRCKAVRSTSCREILQWFSGNIGFHHIHHLSPRIPNYHLEQCHDADPLFQRVKPVTLFSSLKSLILRLWDEPAGKLVGYGRVRQIRREQQQRGRKS